MKKYTETAKKRIIENISKNYDHYFQLGIGIDDYIFEDTREICYCFSNQDDCFFNIILKCDHLLKNKRHINSLIEPFLGSNYPYRLRLPDRFHDKAPSTITNIYGENKLSVINNIKLFWFDFSHQFPATSSKKETGENFNLKTVSSHQDLLDWWIPFQDTFSVKDKVKSFILQFNCLAKEKCGLNFCNIVGYYKSNPICCATIFISNNTACLFDIGTIRPYRHKGFATKMIKKSLQIIKELGYPGVGLYSSSMGDALYQKLNFDEIGLIPILEVRA